MAEVVLFHHVQGLTPGVLAFAETLRGAGHTVHVPDLLDGRTFESIDEGMAYVKGIGFDEVMGRGVRAAQELPAESVYIGFSLGVMPAQSLTQTRAGARGGVFIAGCLPVSEFGSWPDGVPAQVHGAERDPFFADEGDLDAARELVADVKTAELFVYDTDQHLFPDSSLPGYDAAAAGLLTERVLAFLS